jgi:hypothetical protein
MAVSVPELDRSTLVAIEQCIDRLRDVSRLVEAAVDDVLPSVRAFALGYLSCGGSSLEEVGTAGEVLRVSSGYGLLTDVLTGLQLTLDQVDHVEQSVYNLVGR